MRGASSLSSRTRRTILDTKRLGRSFISLFLSVDITISLHCQILNFACSLPFAREIPPTLPNLLENRLTPYAFISVDGVGGAATRREPNYCRLLKITFARAILCPLFVATSRHNPMGRSIMPARVSGFAIDQYTLTRLISGARASVRCHK